MGSFWLMVLPGQMEGQVKMEGTAGLEAQAKTAVAEGMVVMVLMAALAAMAVMVVAMEEMVVMAGTDEPRYVMRMRTRLSGK